MLTLAKDYNEVVDAIWWCFEGNPEGTTGPWDDEWSCPEGESWLLISRTETEEYSRWINKFLLAEDATRGRKKSKRELNPMEGAFKVRIREGFARFIVNGLYGWDSNGAVIHDPVRPERNTISDDELVVMMREMLMPAGPGDSFWSDVQNCAQKGDKYLEESLSAAEKKYASAFAGI